MMLNDLFDYDYKIYQNPEYFKFSIDSILLAEFVKVRKNNHNLMDICTGNLPIPLILKNKFGSKLKITAVEIQKEIYDLGVKTLEVNNINDIEYINDDIKNVYNLYRQQKFDIITCNPPYFIDNHSLVNENPIKAIARHEIKINLADIIAISSQIINTGGYIYLVHSITRLADLVNLLNKYKFGIKYIVPIYPKNNSNAELILIEAQYMGKNYIKMGTPIIIENYDSYKGIFEGR